MKSEGAVSGDTRALEREKQVSLVTYRRLGEAVATPVWFALDGDRLYVETGRGTGKLKRIRHTAQVTVAPCTFGGTVTGPVIAGTARLVADEGEREHARQLMARKYGLVRWLNYAAADVLRVLRRRPKGRLEYIAIALQEGQ